MTETERHRLAMQDAEDESLETLEAAAGVLDSVECPVCGGHAEFMGSLGARKHFTCRNCGNWSSSG